MKCRYTFPLRGRFIRFPTPAFNFQSGDKYYEFRESEKENFVFSVVVSNFPDSSLPSIMSDPKGDIKLSISVPDDPFWDDLLSEVRTIEGALCLWGVDEIDADECEIEWIPENEGEKEKLQMFSISRKRDDSPPQDMRGSSIDMFVRSVLASSDLRETETPLTFYRKGRQDVYEERYIEAIYDLYFMIEYLFAEGKFKKNDVIERFLSSAELIAAIEEAKRSADPEIVASASLMDEFNGKYQTESTKRIIEHFVALRGFLHHYNVKRRDIWHPSEQRKFKVDALTLLRICHRLASDRVISVLFIEKNIQTFLRTEVKAGEGQRIRWNPKQSTT